MQETTFQLAHFNDFLTIARQQEEPQTLLIVLARRELPTGYTEEQKQRFDRGEGGHLAPQAAVDKRPEELTNFSGLVSEASQMVQDWDAVFVAALLGQNGQAPREANIDQELERMVQAIRDGRINQFLVFDRQGAPMALEVG
ncbi:hypothetical protein [Methylophaga nitratireducenticrescens]|uniref:Uncharacterized protein n=1 Tax=Methylophaga nitratireducenticrescens TaxID=754476 RepID=I1XG20_METNJ|nr:hypothetical protein [Methylophaga nitratireducenticrescens]AFI83339.1 ribonucleotide reductase subunit alpha [Methylophaga nitratireducenticrescens]AUZ83459.1 ribonucleotide reductase subunit alpha [Methylophaga nitratireducenticrescens]